MLSKGKDSPGKGRRQNKKKKGRPEITTENHTSGGTSRRRGERQEV